jgi:tetratricopeptide (TPR) repeat protein
VQREQYDQAIALYRELLSGERPDPSLEQVVADLELRKLDRQVAKLDPTTPDHADQKQQLESQKAGLALEQARQRVERYPNDLAFRFELGQRLLEAGEVGEAIAEFQKAQNNPHKRIAAMHHLGRCFMLRGMADLAIRTYQNALKEKPVFDEEKKDLLYDLGLAFAKAGKTEEAMEQFKLIYETDISYRDVAARVDAYYAAKTQAS